MVVVGRVDGARGEPVRDRRHLPGARRPGGAPAAPRAAGRGAGAARHARGRDARRGLRGDAERTRAADRRARPARGDLGQRHGGAGVSEVELVALVCCDLGGIVRGRSLAADELAAHIAGGVGWVPANHALTPLGPLAEPNPFGSTGDLRLLPDAATRVRLDQEADPFELLLCDIVEIDGRPWECCPRRFLREALDALEQRARRTAAGELRARVRAARGAAGGAALLAGGAAARQPVPGACDGRPAGGGRGARALPGRVLRPTSSRSRWRRRRASREPTAASCSRRWCARSPAGKARRASFLPLLGPTDAGNGAHIHLNLIDEEGASLLYDASAPAGLSERGRRVRGRDPAPRGRALRADRRQPRLLPAARAPPLGGGRGGPGAAEPGSAAADPAAGDARGRRAGDADAARVPGGGRHRQPLPGARRDPAGGARRRARGAPGDRRCWRWTPRRSQGEQAERFGVGALPSSLEEALAELESDELARSWFPPLLYDAYVSLKRAELAAVAELDLAERCRLYGNAY